MRGRWPYSIQQAQERLNPPIHENPRGDRGERELIGKHRRILGGWRDFGDFVGITVRGDDGETGEYDHGSIVKVVIFDCPPFHHYINPRYPLNVMICAKLSDYHGLKFLSLPLITMVIMTIYL
jgi:hypothetical protein